MRSERLLDLYALLAASESAHPGSVSLCNVAAEFVAVTGAGIAVHSDASALTSWCTSGDRAAALMDLELMLGEGPCVDAAVLETGVGSADLGESEPGRWVLYSPAAVELGAVAVFGIPMRIGAISIGALSVFVDHAGELSVAQSSDAYLMASVAGRAVLTLQSGAAFETLASRLQRDARFDFVLHQAAGMVAVQGSMSVRSALSALRAHAFATDTSTAQVASLVVERRLRYDGASGAWTKNEETT